MKKLILGAAAALGLSVGFMPTQAEASSKCCWPDSCYRRSCDYGYGCGYSYGCGYRPYRCWSDYGCYRRGCCWYR